MAKPGTHFKTALVLLGLGLSTHEVAAKSRISPKEMARKEAVRQVVVRMVNAIDKKEWSQARETFAEEVFVDYSSLSGQPGGKVPATELVGGWEKLLAKVSTHHLLGNFEVTLDGKRAEVWSHVYASHTEEKAGYWDAFGRYYHELKKQKNGWKITNMTLVMHGQKGNRNFLGEVSASTGGEPGNKSELEQKRVQFLSGSDTIVGTLYYSDQVKKGKKYPAVIISGSWTTVKEQMAGLYAKRLAGNGFITLAFDFRNFGESGGEPRFHENPAKKVSDIKSAVTFLESVELVDPQKVGALGICAGSMYTLMAASEDKRIRTVVTAASWLHDAEAVKLFYGGAEGVKQKLQAGQAAKQKFQKTGKVDYIPTISTTDKSAAMFGPFDYYLNPQRGAIEQWSADKFAVMSWEDWLTLDPMSSAKQLKTPTLMIHSDGAVLPAYTKRYFKNIAAEKKRLHWMETELESPFHQFNFYDQEKEVNEAVQQATQWFAANM